MFYVCMYTPWFTQVHLKCVGRRLLLPFSISFILLNLYSVHCVVKFILDLFNCSYTPYLHSSWKKWN